MFPKIEEEIIVDGFNKDNLYIVGIGKHANPKRVFKYRTIVYHRGKNFITPLECKNFKTYEDAKELFTKLTQKYKKVGAIL